MRKYITILFIAIFSSYNSFTQEYTPYTFENFETEWTHHSYNEDLLDKKINAYYLEDVVITDSAIYVVYAIPSIIWYFNGFLLEKLDAETGDLLWAYTYFQESDVKRETPSQISIKDDNTLTLSTFRELDEEDDPFVWYFSQMNNWVFDTDTGELLDTLTTINGDPNHIPMFMDFNPLYNYSLQSVVNEKNDAYQYLLSTVDNPNVKIIDYTLNELGHLIAVDSAFLPLKYSSTNRSYTTRLNDNKIFNYRKSFDPNNPLDSFNIEITHLDSNLNITYTKNISNDFFGEDHLLHQVNESRFTVLHFGDPIFEDLPYRYMTLYAYDLEGNLLEEVALKRQNGLPLYSIWDFNILPIEELNQTLIVFFTTNETEAYWEWFLTTPNGNMEQIGKTVLGNKSDEFIWSSFNPPYMEYLGDGKVLLYALHLSEEGSSNITETHIPSISIISLDKLRGTVSIENPTLSKVEVDIFPNPTKDYIDVQIPDHTNTYTATITNHLGVLVKEIDNPESRITLKGLSSGIYYVNIFDGKNLVGSKKIVKE